MEFKIEYLDDNSSDKRQSSPNKYEVKLQKKDETSN